MSLLAYNAQQQQQHIKGHESECNYTPSPNSSLAHHPLDPMPGAGVASTPPSKLFGTLPSDQGSPIQRPPPFNFMTSNRRYRNGSPSSVSSSSFIGGNDHNHGGNASFLRKPPVVVKSSGHSHGGGGGSVQQRISQALDMISLNPQSQPTEAKLQSS